MTEPLPPQQAVRLLSRHFVRRFIQNDLMSSTHDRGQGIAMVLGAIVSCGLFVTLLLSIKYLGPIATPGRTALLSLDDKFFFVAYSMAIMAAVAVVIWDALALDALDNAVLGPLPVSRQILIRAKIKAALLVAGIVLLVSNLAPLILFPVSHVATLSVGLLAVVRLQLAHAIAVLTAGAFGFVLVAAIQEAARAVLGAALFHRISATLQSALMVGIVTCFFWIPMVASDIGRSWLSIPAASVHVVPPLWFVGVYESVAADVIDGASRPAMNARMRLAETEATSVYRQQKPLFRQLALFALSALGTVTAILVAAYAWNTRRLATPDIARPGMATRTVRRLARRVGKRLAGTAVQQAGFFFTIHTLFRNDRHRMALASSLGAGLAVAIMGLSWRGGLSIADVRTLPIGVIAVQPVLLTALLVGARHAMRIPASLGANWVFQLAWPAHEYAYVIGVKKAVLTVLAAPVVVFTFAVFAALLGVGPALLHGLCGSLYAMALLDALCLGTTRIPFVSSYTPPQNLRGFAPIYVATLAILIYGLSALERSAIDDGRRSAALIVALVILAVVIRWRDRVRRHTAPPLVFEALDSDNTLQLGLSSTD